MKLNKIILVYMLGLGSVCAQDIGTTQVKVLEGFKPSIPEATRLNENATFTDTIKKDKTQEYTTLSVNLESDYKTRPLKAAKVKADKIPELYATRVTLGFGNVWATQGSILHNSRRSETLSYGVLLNHYANKYEVSYDAQETQKPYLVKNRKNTMHLYAKKIGAKHIFMANLDYDRRSVQYWNQNLSTEENAVNRFTYTKLSFSALSKELAVNRLKHNTQFFISDLNEFSENQIHLSSHLRKTINKVPYSLGVELNNYLNYSRQETAISRAKLSDKIIQLSPAASIKKYGLAIDLSLALRYQKNATENSFRVAPQIKVTKALVEDVVLLWGGLRHKEHRHTLKTLSDENPYLHSFGTNQSVFGAGAALQDLRTTNTDEFYVAMRNVLAKNEVFEGSIAYGWVNNFAHFFGRTDLYFNSYSINYINVQQLHINANYDRKINDLVSLKANADYYNWNRMVYYNPNLTASIAAPLNLRGKIKFVPSISYMNERHAVNYPFDKISSQSVVNEMELSAQFHANLGVYYSYSKQLSAYLKLNNLSNSKQELWSGYKEPGFNGLFGLNYSF